MTIQTNQNHIEILPNQRPKNTATIQPLYHLAHGKFNSLLLGELKQESSSIVVLKQRSDMYEGSTPSTLQRESDIHKHMQHVNIVELIACKNIEHTPTMVLEFVNGSTILDYVQGHNLIDWYDITPLFEQVLDGVEYIHQQGFVHGNLQSHHILINEEQTETVKVIDFSHAQCLNQQSTLVWTKRQEHIAPEQYDAPTLLTASTDIYALGILLDNLLNQILVNLNKGNREPISFEDYFPLYIEQAIRKATHPDPNQRFQDIQELRHSLWLNQILLSIAV